MRCIATQESPKPVFTRVETPEADPVAHFQGDIYIGAQWMRDVPFYERGSLCAGAELKGPCVISERTTSTLLLAGDLCRVHENGHLMISVPGA